MTFATVLLSGLMWFASSGENHIWPFAWLASVPLLVVLPDLRFRQAALATFLAAGLCILSVIGIAIGAVKADRNVSV